MNSEDGKYNIGPWEINISWTEKWENFIPCQYLVFYSSPQAELDAIDKVYESRESKTDIAQELLSSIGINVKEL